MHGTLKRLPLIKVSIESQKRGGAGYGSALGLAEVGLLPGAMETANGWHVLAEKFDEAVSVLVSVRRAAS